jgi:F-type H+-transporting ATPase subunit c
MQAKSYRPSGASDRSRYLNSLESCDFAGQPAKETNMKKFRMIGLAVLGVLMAAMTAAAQPASQAAEAGTSYKGYVALAAGIGFAIAVFGGAIGQSRIGAAACEGAARNPGAAGRIQTMMILGLALIESLVLFALLVIFAVVKPMAG